MIKRIETKVKPEKLHIIMEETYDKRIKIQMNLCRKPSLLGSMASRMQEFALILHNGSIILALNMIP